MNIKEDLTGRIFGQLTVLSRDLSKIGLERGSFWLCTCDCGKSRSVSRHSLVNHGTKSCGCLQKKKAAGSALPDALADKNYWLSKYKKRAKTTKIEFLLSNEEFYSICSKNCFYCGDAPETKNHGYIRKYQKEVYQANGIDRVNPNIGYVNDNCVPCCHVCNFMKTNKTQEDFINKVLKIAKNITR